MCFVLRKISSVGTKKYPEQKESSLDDIPPVRAKARAVQETMGLGPAPTTSLFQAYARQFLASVLHVPLLFFFLIFDSSFCATPVCGVWSFPVAVIEASLDKTRACFEGHMGEDPRPFDYGDGGPGQLVVPAEEEEVGFASPPRSCSEGPGTVFPQSVEHVVLKRGRRRTTSKVW